MLASSQKGPGSILR